MKEERRIDEARKLLDAMGEIDAQYIEEAKTAEETAAIKEADAVVTAVDGKTSELDEDAIYDELEDAMEDPEEKYTGETDADEEDEEDEFADGEDEEEEDEFADKDDEEEDEESADEDDETEDDEDDIEIDAEEDSADDRDDVKAERARHRNYRRNFNRWGTIAAAAAVFLLAAAIYKGFLRHTNLMSAGTALNGTKVTGAVAADETGEEKDDSVTGQNAAIGNPWSDYDSLEDAESCAGIPIVVPESVGHYDQLAYRAMEGEMIEIIYSGAKGQEGLRIRKGAVSAQDGKNTDISGDYNTYEDSEELQGIALTDGSGKSVDAQADGKGGHIYKAIWTLTEDNGTTWAYSVTVNDGMLTAEDMRNLIAAIH